MIKSKFQPSTLLGLLLCINLIATQEPCRQWIVITTINYPTQSLKKLASLENWRLVVVADKKTPQDWFLENCEFLSVEKQAALGYHITELLPWNHYSRKNIGYLYAIAHGAQVIYDTDDDNIIINKTISYKPKNCSMLTVLTGPLVNPYNLFGQPKTWPRGYPIELVQENPPCEITSNMVNPYIQQGLVNNDPDMDAIFRLTRKLPLSFCHNKPICLKAGTMAPFNSQNTIFHYEAFWGLIIPISVSFRVSDIWRGYWVQRLLWEIGGNLCFTGPTAIQNRNAHNYLKDFIDEFDLYAKAGSLIEQLIQWKAHSNSLRQTIIDLHSFMIDQGFFKASEYDFTQAWLEDLKAIGYTMPSIIEK